MSEAEKVKSLQRTVERLKFQLEIASYENEIMAKSLEKIDFILQKGKATIG